MRRKDKKNTRDENTNTSVWKEMDKEIFNSKTANERTENMNEQNMGYPPCPYISKIKTDCNTSKEKEEGKNAEQN